MTGAEIMKQDAEEMEAEEKALLEGAVPKTPLEAAIDRATGFKPEDGVIDAQGTEKADSETEKADSETEKADSETEKADSETEKADSGTEKPETGTEKRDWVGEAVQCFIKDAQDLDPTDPISAIASYFAKNATPELKARCEKEGKNATGCWRFIEAVARKALGSRPGHIDPSAIYAIAMHWFEDVPKDWDKEKTAKARPKASTPKKPQADKSKAAKPKKPAETPSAIRKEKERMAKAKAKAKAKKPRVQQGFFFEMLDMHTGQPEKDGLSSPQASAGASGEENAVVPRTLPASTSSESEVQE